MLHQLISDTYQARQTAQTYKGLLGNTTAPPAAGQCDEAKIVLKAACAFLEDVKDIARELCDDETLDCNNV